MIEVTDSQPLKDELVKLQVRVIEEQRFRETPCEIMVTFNPAFQMDIDLYTQTRIYEQDYSRKIFGCYWFSDMRQVEPWKVWSSTP